MSQTKAQLLGGVGFSTADSLTVHNGLAVTGVVTATSFSGGASGDFSIEDKIVHTGDTNTAIRFPAADTFTVETAGSERLRITSAGNVGIGSDVPLTPLDVIKSGDNVVSRFSNGTRGLDIAATSTGGSLQTYNATQTIDIKTFGATGSDIKFSTNNTERMRVDSSGRVSITNSTPGSFDADADNLVVGSGSGNNGITIYSGNDSLANFYFADGTSSAAEKYAGGINYSHSSNNMAFFTNGGQTAMNIDSAQRVLIGTSAATSKLHVIGNEIRFSNSTNASYYGTLTHDAGTTGANIYNSVDATTVSHIWQNSGNERMRITSAGAFKSSTDGTYQNSSSTSHEFCQSNASVYALKIEHSGTTPSGILIDYSGVTQNDTGSSFIQGEDATTFRFRFASNGGLYNYQANNSNLCDEREKKNIVSLDSKWDKVKNWELKKFHYNEDADTDDLRYGVIAQQVEQHCPELISDWIKQSAAEAVLDDDGNVVTPAKEEILRKGVKEQQMLWMAIKALQEAQTRIEALETKVAALEAA